MTLFEFLNAPADASPITVAFAVFCAEQLILVMPLLLAALWLWGDVQKKRAMLAATLAGLLALLIAQLCGLHYVPRPFAAGVGHTLIPHPADSSFPSDHATLLAAVAVSLLAVRETRAFGVALAVLWFPMAWARVYVGVHFPSDVLGGAVVGCAAALLVRRFSSAVVDPVAARVQVVYSAVCSPFIVRGWLK